MKLGSIGKLYNKYTNVYSGGERMTMTFRIFSGMKAQFSRTKFMLENDNHSYPSCDVADTGSGDCFSSLLQRGKRTPLPENYELQSLLKIERLKMEKDVLFPLTTVLLRAVTMIWTQNLKNLIKNYQTSCKRY